MTALEANDFPSSPPPHSTPQSLPSTSRSPSDLISGLFIQLICLFNFIFIILDINELQVTRIQHGSTTDQYSSPRLPLPCVLLSSTDEQRVSSNMERLFREVQKDSSLVQTTSEKASRRDGNERLKMFIHSDCGQL